jgi:hypothetical protein
MIGSRSAIDAAALRGCSAGRGVRIRTVVLTRGRSASRLGSAGTSGPSIKRGELCPAESVTFARRGRTPHSLACLIPTS